MTDSATAAAAAPEPTVNANNFELNKGDDFIIGLDISGSMQATDTPGGASRLRYSLEQFAAFVKEASKYDTDGVSLYAFGGSVHQYKDIAPEKLDATIEEISKKALEAFTNTHLVVEAAWKEHLEQKNEQTVLMLFTDGQPTDEAALFNIIAAITDRVKDEREFNIAFITVGKRSEELSKFLAKLDDAVPGAKYDIVDVKALEEVDFYKAFEGALND